MTEQELRNSVVAAFTEWRGYNERNGKHKQIIDLYNNHKPLARGYKVKYNDAWCATAASAAAIKAGLTAIIPTECGCERMIELFKKLGRWQENDAYVPQAGDYIFYDWQDNDVGDCTGHSDHVGVVVEVTGNSITVIEGNKNGAVDYRAITVNGRYIRGYGLPNYASLATAKQPAAAAGATENKSGAIMYNDAAIWAYLKGWGLKDNAIAGIMGNIRAESNGRPNNLQNSYEKKLGYTDESYTAAVDNGSYNNFVKDKAGYGLCQWTYWTRKQGLYNYCKAKGASIGQLEAQLAYMLTEIRDYKNVWAVIEKAESVQAVSNVFLLQYERPADQSKAVQDKRASFGQQFYNAFAGKQQAQPVAQPAQQAKRVHKVKAGDNLTKIAKTYGTTVQAILNANRAKYPRMTANYIVVGWELTV